MDRSRRDNDRDITEGEIGVSVVHAMNLEIRMSDLGCRVLICVGRSRCGIDKRES